MASAITKQHKLLAPHKTMQVSALEGQDTLLQVKRDAFVCHCFFKILRIRLTRREYVTDHIFESSSFQSRASSKYASKRLRCRR